MAGTNQLLSYNVTTALTPHSPWNRSPQLDEPLVNNWETLFNTIQFLSLSSQAGDSISVTFIEDQVSSILAGREDLGITTLPVNTTNERIAAFEENLSRLTGTAYALLLDALRTPSLLDPDPTVWNLPRVAVQAKKTQVAAFLRVNGLQVVFGLLSVLALILCVAVSVGQRIYKRDLRDGNSVILTGGALDLISLMHESTLPREVALTPEEGFSKDAQRLRAESTVTECVDHSMFAPPKV